MKNLCKSMMVLGCTLTVAAAMDQFQDPDEVRVPHTRQVKADQGETLTIEQMKQQGKLGANYDPTGKTDEEIQKDARLHQAKRMDINTDTAKEAVKHTGKNIEKETNKRLKKWGLKK